MQARQRLPKGSKKPSSLLSVHLLQSISPTSPTTPNATQPSTPPAVPRRLLNDSRRSMSGSGLVDDDEKARNRMSIDSTASTILGEEDDCKDAYPWTEDQIAIIVRTIEEGQPPSVTHWMAPTTPYGLPFLPDNLVDTWARQLKKSTDWPHTVRSIRLKIKVVAKTVTQNAPRTSIDEVDETQFPRSFDPDAQEEDFLFSPINEGPPNQRRNDEAIYRASMRMQRHEDDITPYELGYRVQANWTRPRSPYRSPSAEPHSPTHSYFSDLSTRNPSTPPKQPRQRSRSASPVRRNGMDIERHLSNQSSAIDDMGFGTPSLSPMKLVSPEKNKKEENNEEHNDAVNLIDLMPPGRAKPRPGIPFDLIGQAIPSSSQPLQRTGLLKPFMSGDGGESSTPNTISTSAGGNFSSISSLSSIFSAQPQDSASTSLGSLQPIAHPRGLQRLPSLPSQAFGALRPSALSELRSGIKRSTSFSKPRDPIKRAPSYGNIKENLFEMRRPSNLSASTSTIQPNHSSPTTIIEDDDRDASSPPPPPVPPKQLGHKRERSDSSVESGYDTEDVPPSSAPSSGVVTQRSPVKRNYETPPRPLPGSPLKPAFDPEKAFTPSPSPTKMLEPPSAPGSSNKEREKRGSVTSPLLNAVKRFGSLRRKGKDKDRDSDRSRSITTSLSPSPSPLPSLVLPLPTTMNFSPSNSDIPASPSTTGFPGSPQSNPPASPFNAQFPPVSPISARFNDGLGLGLHPEEDAMEIDNTPTQLPLGFGGHAFRTPESPINELGGFNFPSMTPNKSRSRKPSTEPRKEGEPPARKRVKTDEMGSPLPVLPDIGDPSETRYYPPRAMSPTAQSEGRPRRIPRPPRHRSGTPSTPSRRVPKSPMLPGASRKGPLTRAISPLPTVDHSPVQTLSTPSNSQSRAKASSVFNNTVTPTGSIAKRPTSLLISRTSSSTLMAATAASKAKAVTRPTPKKEPSFLQAPLLPAAKEKAEKAQKTSKEAKESGSMRRAFPAVTASISSILFPGGSVPSTSHQQPESAPAHITEFPGLGTGEEGVIRAGESAAQARRAAVNRNGRGAATKGANARSRAARSISMLGPSGDRTKPY